MTPYGDYLDLTAPRSPARFRRGYRPRLLWSVRPGLKPAPLELVHLKCKLLSLSGRYQESSSLLAAVIPRAEALGDRRWAARLAGELAHDLLVQGEPGTALPHAERARQLFRELDDEAGLAGTLHTLSGIHSDLGQPETGRNLLGELLELAERAGQDEMTVRTLYALREELGLEKVLERLGALRERARLRGDKSLAALSCFFMGDIYLNTGRWAEAEACNREQYRLARETGNRQGMNFAVGDRGIILDGQGRHREAVECYLEKLEAAEEMGDFYNVFEALGNLGAAHMELGEPHAALNYLQGAEAHTRKHNIPHLLCKSLFLMAKCLLELGQNRRAAEANREALEISREIGYGYVAFNSSLLEARLAAAGDPGKALSMLEALLPMASEPEEEGDVRCELFRLTGDPGHRSEALRLYRLFYERRRLHCTLERIRELEGA